MKWKDKFKMINLLSTNEDDKALDILIKNFEKIDDEAWDMFFNCITLTQENIDKNLDKHKLIQSKLETYIPLSYRTEMKMVYYKELLTPNKKRKNGRI